MRGEIGMRFVMALCLGGALALSACDSDGGNTGSGGTGGSAGSAGTGGGGGSGGGTQPPVITMVAWEDAANCTSNVRSDVVITVAVTDPDTDPGDLIYSGIVGGCDGPINAAVSTVSCPNLISYPGDVTVADPDGNSSAQVVFDVPVCGTGSCTADPTGTCTP
jgi:hypothetical protein